MFAFYRIAIIYKRAKTKKLHLGPLPYYKNFTCRVSYILHLTLIRCNLLTINVLHSVRCCQIHLHKPTRILHTPHAATRHRHGRKISQHRETEKSVAPTDSPTSPWRKTHRIRQNRLRGNGVERVRCVQGSVRCFEIILHS